MALLETCKRELEITVPVEVVEAETGRVVVDVQKKARIAGFRPGKVPPSLVRKHYESQIRQQVLESLIPKFLQKQFERDNLQVVGTPDITDVHFHSGEPLRFKAEFEVMPEFELGDYKDLSVTYHDPEVTEEDVNKRLEELRHQKAEYVNEDPRPLANGDHAVIAVESVAGIEGDPVKNEEMNIELGGSDTLPAFTENLQGMAPADEKDFDVAYPSDYGSARLAGKTVRFRVRVKGVRRKELPELNDDFAQDLGDYRAVEELREAVRKSIFAQRQYEAQQKAKNNLVDQLVDMHDFPVPETFIDRQVRSRLEPGLRELAEKGVDLKKLDFKKLKDDQRDQSVREVKASMLLTRIAEREAIQPTRDEVDKEIERMARQQREPFAAVKLRFDKDGTTGRLANLIQKEKTLSFLFEHAHKTAD